MIRIAPRSQRHKFRRDLEPFAEVLDEKNPLFPPRLLGSMMRMRAPEHVRMHCIRAVQASGTRASRLPPNAFLPKRPFGAPTEEDWAVREFRPTVPNPASNTRLRAGRCNEPSKPPLAEIRAEPNDGRPRRGHGVRPALVPGRLRFRPDARPLRPSRGPRRASRRHP
jgi:hypothetical protein